MRTSLVRNLMAIALASLMLVGGVAWAQAPASGSATTGPFTLGAEALVWWFKSSPTTVPIITDGLLGDPSTKVLLGGGDLNTNPNPGFRLSSGYALNDRWGLESNFLYIPSRSTSRSVSSSGQLGSTDLLLPFFDGIQNQENATEISFAPVY